MRNIIVNSIIKRLISEISNSQFNYMTILLVLTNTYLLLNWFLIIQNSQFIRVEQGYFGLFVIDLWMGNQIVCESCIEINPFWLHLKWIQFSVLKVCVGRVKRDQTKKWWTIFEIFVKFLKLWSESEWHKVILWWLTKTRTLSI